MRRLIRGLVVLAVMLMATQAVADVKQDSVKVTLSVLQIITLDVVETGITIVPGPEDYAVRMACEKNTITSCSKYPADDLGFADRADAINLKIFTNAMKGATVYVHALANPAHNKSLRVEDIYLTVMTEKTYILQNNLERAHAVARTDPGTAKSKWVQMDNEAKYLFSVGKATKAERLIVLKIGIGNLARYTENLAGYEADLTFTLMPRV